MYITVKSEITVKVKTSVPIAQPPFPSLPPGEMRHRQLGFYMEGGFSQPPTDVSGPRVLNTGIVSGQESAHGQLFIHRKPV